MKISNSIHAVRNPAANQSSGSIGPPPFRFIESIDIYSMFFDIRQDAYQKNINFSFLLLQNINFSDTVLSKAVIF